MNSNKLKGLQANDYENFEQLTKAFAHQAKMAQNLTIRSSALLKKKLELNGKLGLDSKKSGEVQKKNYKMPERSEMAKHQAKERTKRNSLSKKNKKVGRNHYEKRKYERPWSREHSKERNWDRRSRKKKRPLYFEKNENIFVKMNTSKILKIEGKKVRVNVNDAERFVFNKLEDLYENQFVEFKRLKGLHLQMIVNYVCGFLNSFGGSLYIGIADDGYIKGITLSRQDIDQFQVDLDRVLRLFHPRVFPDQIKLSFHEIALNSKKQVRDCIYLI